VALDGDFSDLSQFIVALIFGLGKLVLNAGENCFSLEFVLRN